MRMGLFVILFIMNASRTHTFPLCVSIQQYASKPSSNQVGKIIFRPQQVTIESALHYATNGNAFCSSFSSDSSDGTITMADKTEANFQSTSSISYDFDHMTVPMPDFIASLPFKPSFAYTSYSNGVNGYCFRLVYVFDDPIISVHSFNTLYQAIATANSFRRATMEHGGWDKRNVAQMYYGTGPTASKYSSNSIFSQSIFEPYITSSTAVAERKDTGSYFAEQHLFKKRTTINPAFLHDLFSHSTRAFYLMYRDKYYPNYRPSLSTPLILDESEMFFTYPSKYYCVYHKRNGKDTLKWIIGDDRKRKLYITARIMLANIPSMSIENLVYNLALERWWYYENNDGKINNRVLVQTAINAFRNRHRNLRSSKHGAFKVNKDYWVEQGLSANQAKTIVRSYIQLKKVRSLWNQELTIPENHLLLKAHGLRISQRTLERMVTRGDIKIIGYRGRRTYLSCCRDSVTIRILKLIDRDGAITQPEIAATLKLNKRTVKRYMKEMVDKYIAREGNNRSGRWVVLHPLPWEVQKKEDQHVPMAKKQSVHEKSKSSFKSGGRSFPRQRL